MIGVLGQRSLHVHAADGFLKTGWLCSLDDATGDEQILREAGTFWKELNMRAKVNAAVAAVRTEVAAKRLSWTLSDVQRVIKPYPRKCKVDAILEQIGDDAGNDLADASDDDNSNEEGAGHSDKSDLEEGAEEGDGDDEQPTAVAEEPSAGAEEPSAVAEDSNAVADDIIVAPAEAEYVSMSRNIIAGLQTAKETCAQVGSMALAVTIENEIRKEERKLRQRSSENPDLMLALARSMDKDAAEAAKRKRLVDDADAHTLSQKKMRKPSKMPMQHFEQPGKKF